MCLFFWLIILAQIRHSVLSCVHVSLPETGYLPSAEKKESTQTNTLGKHSICRVQGTWHSANMWCIDSGALK